MNRDPSPAELVAYLRAMREGIAPPVCSLCGIALCSPDATIGEFKATASGKTFICDWCRYRAVTRLLDGVCREVAERAIL